MRATAALLLGWSTFALFILWLSYQPAPSVFFYYQDPRDLARWEYCKALHDTWMGGPT